MSGESYEISDMNCFHGEAFTEARFENYQEGIGDVQMGIINHQDWVYIPNGTSKTTYFVAYLDWDCYYEELLGLRVFYSTRDDEKEFLVYDVGTTNKEEFDDF